MPNYSLIINSQFQPFTYAEIMAPIQQSTQAHQTLEDSYGELSQKADVWSNLANKETDSKAHSMYTKYANDLKAKADQLARYGLDSSSRAAMLDMKRRYSSEITPIEVAYNRRKELADEQRKAIAQNPTLMYERDAATESLDKFIDNPMYDYGKSYSGALLINQVSTAAAHLANELKSYGRGRPIDNYTNTFLKRYGYTSKEVTEAINNPDSTIGNKVLSSLRDMVMESSGIKSWANDNTYKRALSYANQGLYSAIGKSDVSPIENFEARKALELENSKALTRYQHTLKDPEKDNLAAINPVNIYDKKEYDAAKSSIEHFKQYFKKNSKGKYYLTKEGREEMNKQLAGPTSKVSSPMYGYVFRDSVLEDSPLKKFIDNMNGEKWTAGYQPYNIGKLWEKYLKDHDDSKYDATKLTEYKYSIDPSDQEIWKERISESAANKSLYTSEWDNKTKTWKNNKSVDMKSAFDNGGKVSSVYYGAYGTTFMITDKDNHSVRYHLPAGINPRAEENASSTLKQLSWIQALHANTPNNTVHNLTHQEKENLVALGFYPDLESVPTYITKETMQQAASQLESQAMMFISQLGNTNSNKATVFTAQAY